jgi:hypothetical protein
MVLGTFRCTVEVDETVANFGDLHGYHNNLNGKAAGNIMGSYDQASNTVSLSSWLTIGTDIRGTLTAMPQNHLDPAAKPIYTISNALVPEGDPTHPINYQLPGTTDIGPNVPLGYYLGCWLEVMAPGSGPITLSLSNRSAQAIVQTKQGNSDLGSPSGTTQTTKWTFSLTPPQYTIQVDLSPAELNPTVAQLRAPAANQLTSNLTITVTADGKPDTSRDVEVTVCTQVGGAATDGHLHDARADPCDASRPAGEIPGDGGSPTNNYPVTKTTDGNGVITTTYYPPNIAAGGPYISGTDQVTAVVQDPTIQDKTDLTQEQDIITRVPDLAPMAGSADCSGGGTYYFEPQSSHGCMFYGTAATNQAIVAIANEFVAAQIACRGGAPYPANSPGAQVFTTPGEPKPVRITAMSLPWGGLNDIAGNWTIPHSTHNSGTQADFGWHDFITGTDAAGTATSWDMDRVLLLQTIILNSGATLPVAKEGGDIPTTQAEGSNAHFHVQFNE